jgi:RimJ/RimL family protein N-acetyltransferase
MSHVAVFAFELKRVPLESEHLVLEPLEPRHLDELVELFEPAIWEWYTVRLQRPEDLRRFISEILVEQEQGKTVAYAIREKNTGKVIGSTRFMNVDAANRRVEIGSTWYAPRWQRTYANTECKLAMLTHAFETLSCISVCFQTDVLNTRSRTAIERLGAKPEGIVRCHRICSDGRVRDSAIYSITYEEWPQVKARLRSLAERPRVVVRP